MLIVVHFTYDKHLVSIPDTTKYTPKELQNLFDQWLFDENIDHECWVYTNGKKDYVAYDVDDFINGFPVLVQEPGLVWKFGVDQYKPQLRHRYPAGELVFTDAV